jgi:xylan 1,4-beta-xylosidase
MSYWTFSDLFEEPGPPTAAFQGGFGLINPQGIRKPAFFAYKYLNALDGREIPTGDAESMATSNGSKVAAVIWDWQQPVQKVSNRPFYTRLVPATAAAPVHVTVEHLKPGAYHVRAYRTGYRHNDPLSAYIDMGLPKTLSAPQLTKLKQLTRDLPVVDRPATVGASGHVAIDLPMQSNDVVLVELTRAP